MIPQSAFGKELRPTRKDRLMPITNVERSSAGNGLDLEAGSTRHGMSPGSSPANHRRLASQSDATPIASAMRSTPSLRRI